MSNCTDEAMVAWCSLGGNCIVLEGGKEVCECWSGFTSDASFYHPTRSDCTRTSVVYIAILLFQTLSAWIVCYRLYTQSLRSKGILLSITRSWIVLVFFIWMLALSFVIQDGMYEAGCFFLAACGMACANAGFHLLRLLIEARYAVEMRSPERTLRLITAAKYLVFALLMTMSGVLIAFARNDEKFNIAMSVWCLLILLLVTTVPAVIVYHNVKFSKSLQHMIDDQLLPNNHHNMQERDEKPDLLKRLKLFRDMVILVAAVMVPLLICFVAVFTAWQAFPAMWIGIIIIFTVFSVIGLKLETMNKMIQAFQDAKLGAAAAMAANSKSAPAQPVTSASTSNQDFNDAVPMFTRSRFLFYLRPRVLRVGQDSLVFYLFGSHAADVACRATASLPFRILAYIMAAGTMVFSWVILLLDGSTTEQQDVMLAFMIVTLAFAVPYILCMVLSQLSLRFLMKHLVFRSAAFQFRVILLIVCLVANIFVFANPTTAQIVALTMLFLSTMLTVIWDSLWEAKHGYMIIMAAMSTSVPFVTWFLLAFDFWNGRHNVVYNGFFSTYHFAADVNLMMLLCIAIDGSRAIKYGINVFLYVFAEINTRYVSLDDAAEDTMEWGETDFAEPDPSAMLLGANMQQYPVFAMSPRRTSLAAARNSSIPTTPQMLQSARSIIKINSATNRQKKKKEPRMQKLLYFSLVILESDSFAYQWLGPEHAKRILGWYVTHPHVMALTSGVMLGAPLILWVGFVLPGTVHEEWSVLCLVGLIPLVTRFLVKSTLVCRYLATQLESWVDMAIAVGSLTFLGIALGGFTVRTGVPLVLLLCTFVDYRFSDALVNMHESTPYHPLVFFPVVLPVLIALPVLGNMNVFAAGVMNTESFSLIPQHLSFPDVFLLENPPNTAFQRIRYSQLVFDFMFGFGVRIALDFIERWAKQRPQALTFIVSPVRPKFCSVTGAKIEEIEDLIQKDAEDQRASQAISVLALPPAAAVTMQAATVPVQETKVGSNKALLVAEESVNLKQRSRMASSIE